MCRAIRPRIIACRDCPRFACKARLGLWVVLLGLGTMAVGIADVGISHSVGSRSVCAGELKPFKVHVTTGDHAGKEVDFLLERKDATTVFVFINAAEWTRPSARYLKKLDEAVAGGIPEAADARLILVWLSDDAAKGKEYLPKAQMSLQLARSDWTVFEGEKAGPGDWNIDIASAITAVVVKKGKETGRVPLKFVNETDVPATVEALKKSP